MVTSQSNFKAYSRLVVKFKLKANFFYRKHSAKLQVENKISFEPSFKINAKYLQIGVDTVLLEDWVSNMKV